MKSIQSLPLQTSTKSGPGTKASQHAWHTAVMCVFHTKGSGTGTVHQGDLKGQAQSGATGIHRAEMLWRFGVYSQLSMLSHGNHWFGSAEVTSFKTQQRVKASLYLFGAWWRTGHLSLCRWGSWGCQNTPHRMIRADLLLSGTSRAAWVSTSS